VAIEKPPQGPDPDVYAAIGKTGLDLGERDVALLLQQRHDLLGVDVGLRRALVPARLSGNCAPMLARKLVPADRARNAHSKPRRSAATAQTPVNRRDDPITQILR